MVRNKPRKTASHGQTDPKLMEGVTIVLSGRSIRDVAEEQGIKKSTLQRYVAKARQNNGTGRLTFTCLFVIAFESVIDHG